MSSSSDGETVALFDELEETVFPFDVFEIALKVYRSCRSPMRGHP